MGVWVPNLLIKDMFMHGFYLFRGAVLSRQLTRISPLIKWDEVLNNIGQRLLLRKREMTG
jgi:hypothetical protein